MKTKTPEYEYPYNFLSVVYGWSENTVKERTNVKTLAGFYYVMSTIAERYRIIIELYYRDNKSFREIGDSIELSGSRIYQLRQRAIRIFNGVSNRSIIYRGPMEYFEVKAGERANVAYQQGYVAGYNDCSEQKQHAFENPSVKEMNLSVRLYHCLVRDGIEDLKQLYATDPKHLMDIRCFGAKCLDELIDVLRLYNLDVQKYIDLKEELCNGNC